MTTIAPRARLATIPGALLLGIAACAPPAPDVLVVTVDTARADRFSYAGGRRVETPHVDGLAAEGTAFLQAVAPTPITLPSHASLWTGQRPPRHGVRDNGSYRLPEDAVTLAELLAARGYRTGAFVAAEVLAERYGLGQGFERYDDAIGPPDPFSGQVPRRRGEAVVAAALDWLAGAGRDPAFVWVHLYDPHYPYDPPEPERSRHFPALYDGEIAYADRQIGVLLEGYRRLGRYDGAAVVITADHGESLGEHGESTHGVFLYEAAVRIPLVARIPGGAAGQRVEAQTELIDVAPTLLGALGLPVPATMEGRDLSPLLRGEAGPGAPRPAYLESELPLLHFGWAPLRALRTPEWKLIAGAATELYRLETDPRERHDLVGEETARAERMERILGELGAVTGAGTPAHREVDPEERRRLEALGYIGAGRRRPEARAATAAPQSGEAAMERPDPRSRIHLLERWREARAYRAAGDHAAATAVFRSIAEEDPGNVDVLERLADLLLEQGRPAAAAEAAERALGLAPEDPGLLLLHGHALVALGRSDEALAVLRRVGGSGFERAARRARWDLLRSSGRHRVLANEAERALAADPSDGEARVALALATHADDPGRLGEALRAAWAEMPGDPEVGAALAPVLLFERRPGEALAVLEEVLRRHEGSPEIVVQAARLHLAAAEGAGVARARELLEGAAFGAGDPELYWTLAEARFRDGAVEEGLAACHAAGRNRPGDFFWERAAWAARTSPPALRRLARLADEARRPERALALWSAAESAGEEGAGPDGIDPAGTDAEVADEEAADEGAADPRLERWQLLARLGRTGELAEEARRALAADPSDAGAAVMAWIAAAAPPGAQPGAPTGTLSPAVTLAESHDPVLVFAAARALEGIGRSADSERLYRRVLELAPGEAAAAARLGRLLLAAERTEEVLPLLEQAAEPLSAESPREGHAGLLTALGEARARGGDYTGALLALERAAALEPLRPDVWAVRGAVLVRVGWALEGVADLRRALALGFDDPSVWFNLGQAYRLLGREEESAAALARAG